MLKANSYLRFSQYPQIVDQGTAALASERQRSRNAFAGGRGDGKGKVSFSAQTERRHARAVFDEQRRVHNPAHLGHVANVVRVDDARVSKSVFVEFGFVDSFVDITAADERQEGHHLHGLSAHLTAGERSGGADRRLDQRQLQLQDGCGEGEEDRRLAVQAHLPLHVLRAARHHLSIRCGPGHDRFPRSGPLSFRRFQRALRFFVGELEVSLRNNTIEPAAPRGAGIASAAGPVDDPSEDGISEVCRALARVLREGIDIHRCQAAQALGRIHDPIVGSEPSVLSEPSAFC